MNNARKINKSRYLLILVIPGILFYIIFCYFPLYGIQLAFRDYSFNKGIWKSDWVGLYYFLRMFRMEEFWISFRNTIIISLGRLLIEFPVPILISILLNEIRKNPIKRLFQTVYTFPFFISWVIAYSLLFNLLSTEGIVNRISVQLGFEQIEFFTKPHLFLLLIFISNIWKVGGWNTIIYLAAISGINQEMYEAAIVDGANRFQRIIHITWPSILPTAITLLILQVGGSMNAGFDQIFNMYNANVYSVADIIDTYIYRMSFQDSGDFSFSTAAGLFKSVINFMMLFIADRIAKSLGHDGVY